MSDELFSAIDAAWDGATPDEAFAAADWASAVISRNFIFKGRKLDPHQPLDWPRSGVVDANGHPIEGVPNEIGNAVYLLGGLFLQTSDPAALLVPESLLSVRLVLESLLAEASPGNKYSVLQ